MTLSSAAKIKIHKSIIITALFIELSKHHQSTDLPINIDTLTIMLFYIKGVITVVVQGNHPSFVGLLKCSQTSQEKIIWNHTWSKMATGRLLDGEEIVKKLMSKNGVFGVSIVDRDGESV